jgi:succinate-acetate transporter protein
MNTRGIREPNMVVGPALAYGGLVQLLAGLWYVYTRVLLGTLFTLGSEDAVKKAVGLGSLMI